MFWSAPHSCGYAAPNNLLYPPIGVAVNSPSLSREARAHPGVKEPATPVDCWISDRIPSDDRTQLGCGDHGLYWVHRRDRPSAASPCQVGAGAPRHPVGVLLAVVGWLISCTLATMAHVAGRMAAIFETKEPPPEFRARLLSGCVRRQQQLQTGHVRRCLSPLVMNLLGPMVEAAGFLTGVLLAVVLPICDLLHIRAPWLDRFRYAGWLRGQLTELWR